MTIFGTSDHTYSFAWPGGSKNAAQQIAKNWPTVLWTVSLLTPISRSARINFMFALIWTCWPTQYYWSYTHSTWKVIKYSHQASKHFSFASFLLKQILLSSVIVSVELFSILSVCLFDFSFFVTEVVVFFCFVHKIYKTRTRQSFVNINWNKTFCLETNVLIDQLKRNSILCWGPFSLTRKLFN